MSEDVVFEPQPGSQEIAWNSDADVIIYGGSAGSGKSHLLLAHPLPFVDDPNFEGIFFRRVTRQLKGAGGLWPESKKMYEPYNPKIHEGDLTQTFESGAKLFFAHMEHEKNSQDHQGLQYSAIFFDELTHFHESQFVYLLSRLRSEAKNKSYCMASCNPDPDSWVLKWVRWWLDDEGYPIRERSGIKRYYVTIENSPRFADTPEELMELYPEQCRVWNPIDENYEIITPKSFTFIGGTIFDNPILIKNNPGYLAELKSLPEVDKARLLDGNWFARAQGANHFQREWLTKVDKIPEGVTVRAWDKAASEPSDLERHPDFTASIGMVKSANGRYTLFGNYINENQHKDDNGISIYGQFRKRAGARDIIIKDQALADGENVRVVLPVDPGSAGKSEYEASAAALAEVGVMVSKDPMPTTTGKLNKFLPFSSACENGLVDICEESFGNRETVESVYKHLESFNGERSTRQRKDDIPDCVASAFNFVRKSVVVNAFSLGLATQATTVTQTLADINKQ